MNKILAFCFLITAITACNDGDIIVTSFDFDTADLETCGGPGSYVLFKINSQSVESISLQLGTMDELFIESEIREFALDPVSNFVNYRTYNGDITSGYFCSNIPPIDPAVTVDYVGSSGLAILVTNALRDDNDGLDEDIDSDLDTDIDGLLNYYDFDDDGDNVPTSIELGVDPENPQDSDGDGIDDYLDTDDDDDGVLTRYEAGGGLDPTTMITDPLIGPDYLNPAVSVQVVVDIYREHTYNLTSSINLSLSNLVLSNGEEEITLESLDLGEKQNVVDETIAITPELID